jgi:hypothetical protein
MTNFLSPLVGAHFRPPAKQLLECLPSGAKLLLVAEPENPYDERAIKVLLPDLGKAIPESQKDALREALPATGNDLDELLIQDEPIHLGYLGADKNKVFAQNPSWAGNTVIGDALANTDWDYEAKLSFSPEGAPMVQITVFDSQGA